MSEKPQIQEIQIIYHATTRWPLSGLDPDVPRGPEKP